jgi:hypothetical protein
VCWSSSFSNCTKFTPCQSWGRELTHTKLCSASKNPRRFGTGDQYLIQRPESLLLNNAVLWSIQINHACQICDRRQWVTQTVVDKFVFKSPHGI